MHRNKQRMLTALDGVTVLWPMWCDIAITNEKIESLRDRLKDLADQSESIQAKADGENRAVTEDEDKEILRIAAEYNLVEDEIERRKLILKQSSKLAEPQGRQTTPEGPPHEEGETNPAATRTAPIQARGELTPVRRQSPVIEPVYTDKGKWGWNNVGEFCRAVRGACARGATQIDNRLLIRAATPSTYGSEGVDSDGGHMVPPDFKAGIMQTIMGDASLLPRTDQQTTSSNMMTAVVDETVPGQTSGGIQVYWGTEGGLKTQSKILLQDRSTKLGKLYALVPVTDELLEDAPSLSAYINRKTPEAMTYAINHSILSGTGAGQPLGILNSAALVSVAAEGGQLADTIVMENILTMWSRMHANSRAGAIWLVTQDAEPQLMQMAVGVNGFPVYLPPNGLSGSPFSTLLGRPVISLDSMPALGDKGDIMLVNFRQYLTVTKVGGMRQDISIHLWFDYDITAFRFVMRIGGQPWWSAPMTPPNGGNTRSPFVTLDAR